MNRARAQSWLFAATVVLAMLMQLLPLPESIAPLKPFWLALVLLYWAIEAPEKVGLGLAFGLGLIGDLLAGHLLGEQSLRLTALLFIVLRFRARLRFFPLWQQAIAVLAMLLNDRVIVTMVRGFSGSPMPSALFWLSPVVGMVLWPFLFILIDDVRARLRVRDS
ncbi:MAG: rod shape-determining protein MreD [Dokdonella sp.]